MNNVVIEQVEETKLLGVTLDRKPSRFNLIVKTVARIGRSLSIIKCYYAVLTALSTRQVLQALVLSHLDYCSVVCSGATNWDLGKLQLAQNRAAESTWEANINDMHVNLSLLKVEERFTLSLLVLVRSVDKLNIPSCLFKL